MINETMILKSDSNNPWYNLAIEELLLDSVGEDQAILYLWQNRDTIVIGRNQNPWKECRAIELEKDGGYLSRRLSGGGTVFHDLGNLNFTFLMNRKYYDLRRQVSVILKAVQKLGIIAEMTGRNDLTVEGRKFSGNAFCFRKENAYHHGTILVSSDLDMLNKYLQVSEDKIKSKGIESVRSRVVNLIEYNPALTIGAMMDAFQEAFIEEYGGQNKIIGIDSLNRNAIEELYKKYASWDWRYGEAPQFDIEMSYRFAWGGFNLCLKLQNGIITHAAVYSDAMDEEFIGMLPRAIKGLTFNADVLAAKLGELQLDGDRANMRQDITGWLMGKKF